MSISTTKINPTYIGYIGSTKDALLIIQACLNNQLLTVPRRPHDRERSSLIASGHVFVFIEERSGIKRWTDGVAWSPSRILGRFLVYRELDRQALNSKDQKSKYNEKKKFRKNSFNELDNIKLDNNSNNNNNNNNSPQNTSIPNRSLVGSLVTSYAFKEYGLIKKTMSLSINRLDPSTNQQIQETIHLVSYYSAEDVLNGNLQRPVDLNSNLSKIQLSNELWNAVKECSLGGKIPIEDEAFYFMDQSNPNAIALGFNPAIHLQPQYQQNKQNQSTTNTSIPSQQSQPQSQQPQSHPQSQQPQSQQAQNFSLPPPQQDLNNLPMFYQYPRYSPSVQYQPSSINQDSSNLPQPPIRRHTTQTSISSDNSNSNSTNPKDISPIIKNEIGNYNTLPNFTTNQSTNFLPQQGSTSQHQVNGPSQSGHQQSLIPQGSYTPVASFSNPSSSNLPFNQISNFNQIPNFNSNPNSSNPTNLNQGQRWFGYDENGYVGYQNFDR